MKKKITVSFLILVVITIFAYGLFFNNSVENTVASLNKLGPITVSFAKPKINITTLEKIDSQISEPQMSSDKTINVTEKPKKKNVTKPKTDRTIPFFSQFNDISDPSWKKVGCGIASLAMIIELYEPGKVSVDKLLNEGIESGAYLNDAGWIHSGLIALAKKYGLKGNTHDLSGLNTEGALKELEDTLIKGPVMASVHYTFDPTNPIPHLVVINKIIGDTVYYNDPSEKVGNGSISTTQFLKAWKKRYIEIRPA